ncbi:MAG: PrsW family glutamic-type intramembrane protease [Saprospiraceae bacterium]|nr:PrsW family intramembrane metalloprotease [Lewinellaceae bacterium]
MPFFVAANTGLLYFNVELPLLLLAVLPGLLISYAIFRADKYDREPLAPLLFCFFMGAAVTVPVVLIERWAYSAIGAPPFHLGQTAVLAFGVLAVVEEVAKFLLLLLLAYPRKFFNEPLDGIVYAVLIAMGFATLENVVYAGRFGLHTTLVRALTAVPAHLAFAIVQGYFAGLAKFDPPRESRLLLRGLALAILLHGSYDLLIMQNLSQWLAVLGTLALYVCLVYCTNLVRDHQDHSPFRNDDDA